MARSYDPRVDGIVAARAQWCREGERVLWGEALAGSRIRYEMPGRRADGRPRQHLGVRVLKGAAVTALGVAGALSGEGPDGSGRSHPPRVIAFGPAADCRAACLASPTPEQARGLWVFTTQRFAFLHPAPDPARPAAGGPSLLGRVAGFAKDVGKGFVTKPRGPHEPVRLTAFFSLESGGFTPLGHVERKLKGFTRNRLMYERVVLPDCSGFDFLRDG